MIRSLAAALLAASVAAGPGYAGRVGSADALASAFKPFLDAGVVPGVVYAVITPEGVVVRSLGRVSEDDPSPPSPQAKRGIASVTKVFTAVALADLVREGKIDPAAPAASYLPAGARLPERDGKRILVAHLASHTSGLPAGGQGDISHLGWFSPTLWRIFFKHVVIHRRATRLAGISWDDLLDVYADYPLPTAPGDEWQYSNIGSGLLGHLLELVDGRPFEEVLMARVIRPLGLADTRVSVPEGEPRPPMHLDLGPIAGAGGLYSTLNDLVTFTRAAMGLAESPVKPAFELSQRIHHRDAKGKPYPLGWGHDAEKNRFYHQGGNHAFVGFDKSRRTGVAVLCMTGGLGEKMYPFSLAALDLVAGRKADFPKPRLVVELPAGVLARFAGRYVPDEGDPVTLAHDGKTLTAHFKKGTTATLWPESETEFFCREWDYSVTFELDGKGAVTGATMTMYAWTGTYVKEGVRD